MINKTEYHPNSKVSESDRGCFEGGYEMAHKIITINRLSGSGGGQIGEMLAQKLGISCYDEQLRDMALDFGDLDESKHAEIFKKLQDEKKPNLAFYRTYDEGNTNVAPQMSALDTVFDLERQIMLKVSKEEDAVIIGRCGNWVFKNAEDVKVLSVFIVGSMKSRIDRVVANSDMDATEAKRHIKKVDRTRDDYYYYITKSDRDDLDSYGMVINSGVYDEETCVNLIAGAFEAL